MNTASTTEAANNAYHRITIYLTDVNQTNTIMISTSTRWSR